MIMMTMRPCSAGHHVAQPGVENILNTMAYSAVHAQVGRSARYSKSAFKLNLSPPPTPPPPPFLPSPPPPLSSETLPFLLLESSIWKAQHEAIHRAFVIGAIRAQTANSLLFPTCFSLPPPPHLSSTAERPNTKQYIVHLSSVPSVLSYRGGVNGLRATATVDNEEDECEDEEDVDDVDDEDYGEDGDANGEGSFDADIQFAAAAAAEAAMELAGIGGEGAAAGAEGSEGVAAVRGWGGGGGGRGAAVKVSALPFARTGLDVLVERVAGDKAPRASGATSAVLTVQNLSARAARIMRATPWGRLMRPDVRLPHVQAFTRFLEASHRSLLQSLKIPSSAIFHSYTYLTNSFAAQLTVAEARRLKRHPAVAEVERDQIVRVTSVHSPEFLKLDSSLWPANGGQSNAGEGVIIGVIDSGIWPEHPSFSNPDPNGAPYSTAPVRWRGVCTKTKDFTACNGKVVGARFFLKGMEREYGRVDSRLDYRSPRDMDQHGTWCAGAAAGNAGVDVTKGGRTFGTASGMAPRARLAIYKGLWSTEDYEGLGVMSDLVAAANKAVADGVDIISCSWGGMARYFQDMPYLQALKAGVVTAFAAGNDGRPNPWSMWGTISNASPFYLTVGARYGWSGRGGIVSDYKGRVHAVLTLGDGKTFTRASLQIEWDGTNTLSTPHLLSLLPNIPAPHRSTMGRECKAVLTLGWAMEPLSFPPPFSPHRPPRLPTAPHRSTMGREYKAVLTLGDGSTFTGRGLGGTTATASDLPLVLDTTIV
ncbi:unnamed protein product [Closterium sp. Naga37s-1]|nr:unnamed protein product [Closterium sp. Naga37s-1]